MDSQSSKSTHHENPASGPSEGLVFCAQLSQNTVTGMFTKKKELTKLTILEVKEVPVSVRHWEGPNDEGHHESRKRPQDKTDMKRLVRGLWLFLLLVTIAILTTKLLLQQGKGRRDFAYSTYYNYSQISTTCFQDLHYSHHIAFIHISVWNSSSCVSTRFHNLNNAMLWTMLQAVESKPYQNPNYRQLWLCPQGSCHFHNAKYIVICVQTLACFKFSMFSEPYELAPHGRYHCLLPASSRETVQIKAGICWNRNITCFYCLKPSLCTKKCQSN